MRPYRWWLKANICVSPDYFKMMVSRMLGQYYFFITKPDIVYRSFPDLGDLRNNRKKVQESGTFKKKPDFLHQTRSLKPLPIGQGNKSLGAKRPIIGGSLCTTPYKNGA
jgi:hypothetical protein